jgi:hypothetical protein
LSPDVADRLIMSSRPRGGLIRGPMFILLGLSILLGALSADSRILPSTGALSWILPQILLIAVAVVLVWTVRRQRKFARDMQETTEAIQLGQWSRAWPVLNRLLGRPVSHPTARAESLLALAAVAEANGSFETSQRIYESVLEERQGDPLQLHSARVGLGAALLRTGQTTDAVGLIDRLEREELPGSLRAHIELLALFRELTMGHAADRLDRAEERRALFRRHLGTRAAYGYALLALLFDQTGDAGRARRAWHDATLLLPAAELVQRFEQLQRVAAKYAAAVAPPGLIAASPSDSTLANGHQPGGGASAAEVTP